MNEQAVVIYTVLAVLGVMCVISLAIKAIIVTRYKNAGLAIILKSFFRVYNTMELKMTSNNKKRVYMQQNNLINKLLYVLVVVSILFMVVYNKVA